jgi:4-hydroxy-4-methyl-2-oxoglutarate aldolase
MASPDLGILRNRHFKRATSTSIESLAALPSSVVGDALGRRIGLGPNVQALTRRNRFAGSALTVRCRAGDNLAALVSLESTQPGDVVVIACGGARDAAVVGGNYLAMAKIRGAVAVITDGLIRDLDEIEALEIPVFAAGLTPNGPFKSGPGQIGMPVAINDITINSGDILVGDPDGVVVVPQNRVSEAIAKAAAVKSREADMAKSLAKGEIPDFISKIIAGADVSDVSSS